MDGATSALLRSGSSVVESFDTHSLLISVTLWSALCSSKHWSLLVYADASVAVFPGTSDFAVRNVAFARACEGASKGDQTAICAVSCTDVRTCEQSRYVEHRHTEVNGSDSYSLLATS